MNINEWFAKQCGVKYLNRYKAYGMLDPTQKDELGLYIKWDIKDPRCMQVVREKFLLSTNMKEDGTAYCYEKGGYVDEGNGWGDTIPKAEYACCEAIYEARDEL